MSPAGWNNGSLGRKPADNTVLGVTRRGFI
jgi:hypothetical protein